MKLYCYCSYDGSSVGYLYGGLNITDMKESASEGILRLKKENIPDFVNHCFQCGSIRRVFGQIPGAQQYLLMIKKLKAVGDDGVQRYMNFALVFEDSMELQTIHGCISEQMLEKMFAKAMVIDTEDEFGYKLDAKALYAVLNQNLKSLFKYTMENKLFADKVCYISTIKGTTKDILSNDLEMQPDEFSWEDDTDNETIYRYPQKKMFASSNKRMPMLLAIFIVLAVISLIWMIRK